MSAQTRFTTSFLVSVLFISALISQGWTSDGESFQTMTTKPEVESLSLSQHSKLNGQTPLERKCSLLNNFYMSDVDLVVKANGQDEIIIPAHRALLAFQSPKLESILNAVSDLRPRYVVQDVSQHLLNILLR